MRPVATDGVACLSVGLSVTTVNPEKTAEPIGKLAGVAQ